MSNWVNLAIGSVLSLGGSLFVSWIFYRRASEDLDKKMALLDERIERLNQQGFRLERLVEIVMKVIDDPENTSVRWGQDGKPLGNIFNETSSGVASVTGKARANVRHAAPDGDQI